MAKSLERPLPYSAEAERALLGAILRDPSQALHEVLAQGNLTSEHFFLDVHRMVFEQIIVLQEKGGHFDSLDVAQALGRQNEDFRHYPIELVNQAPVSLNIVHYAENIKKHFYLRRIILACQTTIQQALTLDGSISDFIEGVEKEFLSITKEQEKSGGLISAKLALDPALAEIERRIASSGDVTGVPSGFSDLDAFTGGWQKSDLIILAARPGMGKTALAINWAVNAIKTDDNLRVAIFTLEMSKEQLIERVLSAEGRIESTHLRKGTLDEEAQDRLLSAARFIFTLDHRLSIDETPGITLMEVRSRCRRFQKEFGLNLVIIDYLQLMSGSAIAQKQSREREISEISMGLKSLAKEIGVPIVAIAQLNRGPDARPDKKPRISDLRESGSMEQDADQILFVYRDEYYNPESEHSGKAEVIVAKNRHGETGSLFLAWQPHYVSFYNLMPES